MRILQIRFKNLNSLAGEWIIDLTHPAFATEGIFAITGPTGAGKSTLLDALCLALYGRTPRLSKVTQSGNEILSRQTGACFAEATFATQSGRYRCHWSQHRARQHPEGALQAPRHEIARADSGEVLESSIRRVADRVESVTGMDFDRFTRSMLLAQGGFAAFLQAAPDERAPILEQITGTEIYSRISILVHERQREERERLQRLEAETAGIEVMAPEEAHQTQGVLDTKLKEATRVDKEHQDLGQAISWLQKLAGLKQELAGLAQESSQLQADIQAFAPERDKLKRALSASALEGAYAELIAIRRQQASEQEERLREEEALPRLETSAAEQAQRLAAAEQQHLRAREEVSQATPLWRQVRALDQSIAAKSEAVAEVADTSSAVKAKVESSEHDKKAALQKRAQAQKQWQEAEAYLEAHAEDEALVSGLAGLEAQLQELGERRKALQQLEAEQSEATKALETANRVLEDRLTQSEKQRQALAASSERLGEARKVLEQLLDGRLLREYRAEQEALLREMAYLQKIAELEDHRARLEDGQPCPLCGALEHPYAIGNIPSPDATQQKIDALSALIQKAEGQEAAVRTQEASAQQARERLTEAESQETRAQYEQQAAETRLSELSKKIAADREDMSHRSRAVAERLRPLGITDISEMDAGSLLESLKARREAWQAEAAHKAEMDKAISRIDGDIKGLDALIGSQGATLKEYEEKLKNLERELVDARVKRQALYADKNPDTEEQRLNRRVEDAEAAEKQARTQEVQVREQWGQAQARLESLRQRIDQRQPELDRLEKDFRLALGPKGFTDEAEFLAARLPAEQRQALETKAQDLEQRQTDINARRKDREARLAEEKGKALTDQSLEILEPRYKEHEETLTQLRDSIAGLKYRLKENAAAMERIKEKRLAIEAQHKECQRWDILRELIGSADGKKFRNFAQGLTFQMMIGHANRQLQKMTDRYLLTRDEHQPLELNVVDNYQAGEIRSTKNLSGGESFIVSLALALGLSQMASRNVRVDSLFLDEGFGTLDEDALDTALETLAGLQEEGKLIGVISHVQALKERISTRIQVTPENGGRSRIEGPGCQRQD